jgi:tetratricopeptide (TPR) repeat protein
VTLGRLDEALQSCERALALRPAYADALYNRGNVLRALDRFEEACSSYAAVLALEPRRADALNNMGLALMRLERPAEALEKFDAALDVDPDDLGALHNRANALTELGAFEAALKPCEAVLRQNPAQADAHNTRGVVLSKLRRFDEALASYDAALAIAPDRVDIEVNRGTALLDLKRHDEALASFDKVLARDSQNVTALVNRGNAFIRDKRFADALDNYDKALAIVPDLAAALTGRGVALAEMDRFEEALAAHERALAVEPHVVAAHVNRGNALLKLTRMEEALASYAEALALEPEHADANFNAAMTRLSNGDFRNGWPQYEYRWKTKNFESRRLGYPQPVWRGERDLRGKTVFLIAEQGLGDTINFMRYAPLVAELGAKVILHVQHPLKALAATVPGVAQVFSDGEPLPQFDLYCPLLSLPLAFETELATIPANIPYVRPLEARLANWRGRMPDRGRLRVGLCWAGSSMHLNDRSRSIALDRFASILSIPGLDFISVQKDVTETQAAVLREHGVVQLGQQFADFGDSAAVVAMLDLLVSVDTSIAHLAGAMGKAVALLLPFSPDFRWLLHRSDSPWYPTARLFRQSRIGDWDGPLEQVHTELADLARRPPRVR